MSVSVKDGWFGFTCSCCGDFKKHTLSMVESNAGTSVKFEMLDGWTYGIEDDEIVSLCEECSEEYEPYNEDNLSIKDFCRLDNERFI